MIEMVVLTAALAVLFWMATALTVVVLAVAAVVVSVKRRRVLGRRP